MNFVDLNLEPPLQENIQKLGYNEATPIQAQAISPILEGKDVAGLAQTGTGKTAAFLIPLIEKILLGQKNFEQLSESEKEKYNSRAFKNWKRNQFILILVPTRELAEQVQENIIKFCEGTSLKGFAIYGGTGYDKQKEALRDGVEFIVATPGRLIDLFKEHLVDLKQVRAIVFDEADRMFDMGFKDDMKFILQRIPRERQFLVFSATLNFDVLNTAYQFGADPVEFNISRDQAKAENVIDEIFHVGNNEKPQHVLSLLKKYKPRQTIIFTNFKMNVERLARFLVVNDFPAMAISSLISQSQRNKVMQEFKAENNMNILVATDVAARGLDIKGVDLVINYELPNDSESYVHRIGRTGRAGADGRAFSLVGDKDVESLVRLEEYLKHKLNVAYLEDADLVKEFKDLPREDYRPHRPYDSSHRGTSERRPPRGGSGGRPHHKGPRRDSQAEGNTSGEARQNKKPDFKKQGPHPKHKKHQGKFKPRAGAQVPAPGHPSRGPKTRTSHSSSRAVPAASKSVGQKVVGFFKSLIGKSK